MLAITHNWEGERFPDGRPRVSDDILHRTTEWDSERSHDRLWS